MPSPLHTQHTVDFSKGEMSQNESRPLLEVLKRGRYKLEAKLRDGCSANEFSQLTQLLAAVEAAEEFIESSAV